MRNRLLSTSHICVADMSADILEKGNRNKQQAAFINAARPKNINMNNNYENCTYIAKTKQGDRAKGTVQCPGCTYVPSWSLNSYLFVFWGRSPVVFPPDPGRGGEAASHLPSPGPAIHEGHHGSPLPCSGTDHHCQELPAWLWDRGVGLGEQRVSCSDSGASGCTCQGGPRGFLSLITLYSMLNGTNGFIWINLFSEVSCACECVCVCVCLSEHC